MEMDQKVTMKEVLALQRRLSMLQRRRSDVERRLEELNHELRSTWGCIALAVQSLLDLARSNNLDGGR